MLKGNYITIKKSASSAGTARWFSMTLNTGCKLDLLLDLIDADGSD